MFPTCSPQRTATCSPQSATGKRKGENTTWLSSFWSAWVDQYGGEPSAGQLAKTLKPLVDDNGTDEVLRRWVAYMSSTSAAFASPSRFAQTFGSWGELALKGPPADYVGTWPEDGLYYDGR